MIGVFVQTNAASPQGRSRPTGYIIQENGCWDWVGALHGDGYGLTSQDGKMRRAHRVMYERERGPIPSGLVLDHICRNPRCVRPGHLQPVSRRENTLRGTNPAAVNAQVVECPRGHVYTTINTLYRKRYRNGVVRGCRQCDLDRKARERADRKRWNRDA